ncbi:MAG: L,D-transpeptidase, partial [Neisseriaceae bacterium]|nr:L,D-transpeptidase [Neisseriaceae bacterium]
PDNPLGPVFIRFGDPSLGLGMHGTTAPQSVPGLRSHGCVRLKSPDALTMAELVEIKKTRVSVIYQTTLLNIDEAGHLWLLKLADGYKMKPDVSKQYAQALSNYEIQNGVHLNQKRVTQGQKLPINQPFCLSCSNDKIKIKGALTSLKWLSSDIMPPITSPKEKIPQQPIAPTVPTEELEPSIQVLPMEMPADFQSESSFLPRNLDEVESGEIEALP